MYNNGTATQCWVCLIIKDVMAEGINNLYVGMEVETIADQVNKWVECTFYSPTESGDIHDIVRSKASQYYSNGAHHWRVYSPHCLDSASDGYCYARCMIPGKRAVNGQMFRFGMTSLYYSEND